MNLKTILICMLVFCMQKLTAQQTAYPEKLKNIKRPKIGLVLSGGGAKGLAHIGVLKVLEECGIRPDYITGTSMGSIVGGFYALGYSASDIEDFVNHADWSILLSDKITWKKINIFTKDEYPEYPLKFIFNRGEKPSLPSGMIEGQQLHNLFSKLTWASNKYHSFDDFPIPYRCVATDIMSGKPVVFDKGNLADAMRTSMSIPTVFSPVVIDSLLLADGGMVRNYPVQECIDMGADIIIGSYTGFNEKAKPEDVRSLISILARSSVFQGINDAKVQIPKTDILIVPDLKGYGAESFSKANQIMVAGEEAARKTITYLQLEELGKICKNNSTTQKKDSLGNIKIDQIIISGPSTANIKLIEELCNIYPGKTVNQDLLSEATNKLYATGDYKKVAYQIITQTDKNILVFRCTENEVGKIELGLHYNNSFGPAVLARFSYRGLFFPNSLLKTKIAFSENPMLHFDYDYYLSKRKNTALFLESYLQTLKMPNVVRNQDSLSVVGHYRYNHFNFALGAKWRLWENGMLEAKVGQNYNALRMKEGMQYVFEMDRVGYSNNFAMASFKINNLDDPFFPTKGICLNLSYKWLANSFMSNQVENIYSGEIANTNGIGRFDFKQCFRIKNRVSIIPELQLGFMDYKAYLSEAFFIGGNNYMLHPNAINMNGFAANSIIADDFLKVGLTVQVRLFEKWFVQYGQEALGFMDSKRIYTEDEFESGESFTSWYSGIGVSTSVGPLRLVCSGSYEQKNLYWSLNLGIPF